MTEIPVETISEERASRCLQRIDLLNKIRHDVLKSEHFDDWIMNRCAPSSDLPDWYVPGKHDRDLVQAAARYGITRTEFYYVQDGDFSFKRYLYKYMKHIEELMADEAASAVAAGHHIVDDGDDPVALARLQDPIQYYFQNQAKIQITFKEMLSREQLGEAIRVNEKVVQNVKGEENDIVVVEEKCDEKKLEEKMDEVCEEKVDVEKVEEKAEEKAEEKTEEKENEKKVLMLNVDEKMESEDIG